MSEQIVSKYQAKKMAKLGIAAAPKQEPKPKKVLPALDPNRKMPVFLTVNGIAIVQANGKSQSVKVTVDKVCAPHGVVDEGVLSAARNAIHSAVRGAGIRGDYKVMNGERGFQYKPWVPPVSLTKTLSISIYLFVLVCILQFF